MPPRGIRFVPGAMSRLRQHRVRIDHAAQEVGPARNCKPFPARERIQLARAVQRVELVTAADVACADEDLREGRAVAGA